jgi:flagellar biosynthesis anti-sigma factor FlgM
MNMNRIQQDLVRLYGGRPSGVRGGHTPSRAAGGAEEAAATRGDDVVLSESASALRTAFGLARSASDVRAAYVAELRSQVQAGTYHVPAEALAKRLAEAGVLE